MSATPTTAERKYIESCDAWIASGCEEGCAEFFDVNIAGERLRSESPSHPILAAEKSWVESQKNLERCIALEKERRSFFCSLVRYNKKDIDK